jgi:hypothetical protein
MHQSGSYHGSRIGSYYRLRGVPVLLGLVSALRSSKMSRFFVAVMASLVTVGASTALAQEPELLVEQPGGITLSSVDDTVAWTQQAADGSWQLVIDRGGTLTTRRTGSNVLGDLGRGPAGRPVRVFQRCARPVETSLYFHWRTGCDIHIQDLTTGRVKPVRGASSKNRIEFTPTVWGRHVVFGATPEFPTRRTEQPRFYVVDLLSRHPRPHRILSPSSGVSGPNCPRNCFSGPVAIDLRGSTLAYVWGKQQTDPDVGYLTLHRVYIQSLNGRPHAVSGPSGYGYITTQVTPDHSSVWVLRRTPRLADGTDAVENFGVGRPPSIFTTLPGNTFEAAFTSKYVYWVEDRTQLGNPVRHDFALLRRPLTG